MKYIYLVIPLTLLSIHSILTMEPSPVLTGGPAITEAMAIDDEPIPASGQLEPSPEPQDPSEYIQAHIKASKLLDSAEQLWEEEKLDEAAQKLQDTYDLLAPVYAQRCEAASIPDPKKDAEEYRQLQEILSALQGVTADQVDREQQAKPLARAQMPQQFPQPFMGQPFPSAYGAMPSMPYGYGYPQPPAPPASSSGFDRKAALIVGGLMLADKFIVTGEEKEDAPPSGMYM